MEDLGFWMLFFSGQILTSNRINTTSCPEAKESNTRDQDIPPSYKCKAYLGAGISSDQEAHRKHLLTVLYTHVNSRLWVSELPPL